jgi:hypothetical protein
MAKRIQPLDGAKGRAEATLVENHPRAAVDVIDSHPGPTTTLDRAKGYYHTIITLVGAVLVLLNQITPVTDFLPASVRGYVSVAIVFVTAALNFLKSNEHWVDDL